jgi:hypothetical protein
MTDFSSVTNFCIRFGDHPEFPDASAQLNSLYDATLIDDPAAFSVDPTSCTDVRPDQDLMNLLCNVLINEVINPVAIGTTVLHPNSIRVAIMSSPICVCLTNSLYLANRRLDNRRLTAANMTYYLRNALLTKVPSITFIVRDMFPKDSRLHAAVSSLNGCGYRALFPSHPAFQDQPSIMIKSYPRQKSTNDLLRYVQLFRDFLQLCAYITNNPATLDDPTEVDIIINNLTYSTYVNRVTCNKRRLALS